ncbi:hypothetical protein GTA08_BOTSDO01141 [Botryosphaeria dothidea]|uniref:Uncharacterized protein n=1 Tax=Botryosphaeria dothidea TaxID=55169 RepID=A0A8H4J5W8_9PEZI|nr:hypothetical protein GTA08_BOTSDO01141 [Botryosphaeria dothidea]
MTGPDDRELDFGELDQNIAVLKIGPEKCLFNVHKAYDDDIILTKVYIFADRCDIPQLRQDVLSWSYYEYYNTVSCDNTLPTYEVITLVFDSLPSSSKLCEFYVDLYTSRWDPTYDNVQDVKEREKLPTSFLLQLVTRISLGNIICRRGLSSTSRKSTREKTSWQRGLDAEMRLCSFAGNGNKQ